MRSTRHVRSGPPSTSAATICVPCGSVGTSAFRNAAIFTGSRRLKACPCGASSVVGVTQSTDVAIGVSSGAGRVTTASSAPTP